MATSSSGELSGRRKLAAILFSDIRGYSKQMESDEDGMLRRLDEHNAIFRERVDQHGGRVIKTVGDAFMIEFGSAIDAVRCALAVQRALAERNERFEEETEKIIVRMGVHFGDVVERDGDLFGETVNLAARLEPQAPPGGICVSDAVFRQVRRKVDARVENLGPRTMKNIEEPMVLNSLTPAPEWLEPDTEKSEPRKFPIAIAVAVAAALVAVAVWSAATVAERNPFAITPEPSGAQGALAPAPRRGGVLRVGRHAPLGHLNPLDFVGTLSRTASDLVVEALVVNDDAGEPSLHLLESAEAVDRTLTLVLRDDVVFHPHPCLDSQSDRRATAKDLAYSIRLAARSVGFQLPVDGLEPYRSEKSDSLAAVQVVGARTVTVRLTHPTSLALAYLWPVQLLPHQLADCDEDLRAMSQLVGTGPFRMTKPKSGDRITLVRNDAYRDPQKRPVLDGVSLQPLGEGQDGVALVDNQELDVVLLDPSAFEGVVDETEGRPKLVGDHPNARMRPLSFRNKYLQLLLVVLRKDGPLGKRNVRRAVAFAMDRDALAAIHSRPLVPMPRFYPSGTLGRNVSEAGFNRDLEKAHRLLTEAGHPKGKGLEPIVLATPGDRVELARVMAKQLAEVGIRMRVEQVDLGGASAVYRDRKVDVLLIFTHTDKVGPEPFNFVTQALQPARKHDIVPQSVEGLLARLHTTQKRVDREPIYAALERELLEHAWTLPVALLEPGAAGEVLVAGSQVDGLGTGELPRDWPSRLWLRSRAP